MQTFGVQQISRQANIWVTAFWNVLTSNHVQRGGALSGDFGRQAFSLCSPYLRRSMVPGSSGRLEHSGRTGQILKVNLWAQTRFKRRSLIAPLLWSEPMRRRRSKPSHSGAHACSLLPPKTHLSLSLSLSPGLLLWCEKKRYGSMWAAWFSYSNTETRFLIRSLSHPHASVFLKQPYESTISLRRFYPYVHTMGRFERGNQLDRINASGRKKTLIVRDRTYMCGLCRGRMFCPRVWRHRL